MSDLTTLAENAIDALNLAAVTMHRQLKTGRLNKDKADKLISAAQSKTKAANQAYFKRRPKDAAEHQRQLAEARANKIIDDLTESSATFYKVLKHYAAAAGVDFIQTEKTDAPKVLNPAVVVH